MHSIAFLNFKGGVSKTTTVVNLGAALAVSGKRVLLVDCDPQSHVAQHVGIPQSDVEEGLEDVLKHKRPDIREIALETNTPNLLVAPSTNALSNARAELATRPMREGLLHRALRSVADEVDFVLIDSPPDEGVLSVNALYACDSLVIPTTLDQFAVSGVPKVLAIRESLTEAFGRQWPLLGALICKHDKRTATMNRSTLKTLEETVGEQGVFATRIRTDESVKKAQSQGQTLFEYEAKGGGNAAEDYRKLAKELMRKVMANGRA